MNGWWLPPAGRARTVSLSWGPQRAVWLGLAVTAVTALVALVVAVRARRPRHEERRTQPVALAPWERTPQDRGDRRSWFLAGLAGAVGVLVITPLWGLAVAVVSAVLLLGVRRPLATGLVAAGAVAVVGLGTAYRTFSIDPIAGFGWVAAYEELHRPALVAVLMVTVAAASQTTRRSEITAASDQT
jgi:hypothetical protein